MRWKSYSENCWLWTYENAFSGLRGANFDKHEPHNTCDLQWRSMVKAAHKCIDYSMHIYVVFTDAQNTTRTPLNAPGDLGRISVHIAGHWAVVGQVVPVRCGPIYFLWIVTIIPDPLWQEGIFTILMMFTLSHRKVRINKPPTPSPRNNLEAKNSPKCFLGGFFSRISCGEVYPKNDPKKMHTFSWSQSTFIRSIGRGRHQR